MKDDTDAVNQLGPMLLRCRNRRRKDAWLALGGSRLTIYLTPLMAALFLTFLPTGIAMQQNVPPPLLKHPVWGPFLAIWFIACSAGIFWYYFTAPRSAFLALHEGGFRYRRRIVPFAELSSLRVGRVNSRVVDALVGFNRLASNLRGANRAAAQMAQNSDEASVRVELKDGTVWSMNNILVTCEADDLEKFFAAIGAKHPELVPSRQSLGGRDGVQDLSNGTEL